jgi:hypothetical protein
MNLLPPIPTAGGPAPNLAPLLVAAVNTDSLALLGKLVIGDILSGTVLGRSNDGQTMIRTDRGVMALAGAIDAAEGSKVTLEVRATGARLQFVLLSVEAGKPDAAAPSAPIAPRAAPSSAQAAGAAIAQDAARAGGAELIATVLRGPGPGSPPIPVAIAPLTGAPSAANAAAPQATPTIAAPTTATPATATMLAPAAGVAPAPAAANASAALPASSAPVPAAPIAAPPATPVPTAPVQPLAAGQRLALNVAAVIPPESPKPPVPPAPGFVAVVRTLTPTGQPILDTPLGTLAIERALAWPVGTRVLASFQPIPLPPDAVSAAPQRGWTALLEAAALLGQSDRPDLNAALERVLPRIGPHLAVGLASFLKPRTDPADLAGPELKSALAKIDRGDLAQRLHAELGELGRALPNSEPGWRTVILPLVDENRLQQAMLAIRRDPPQREGAERGEAGGVHFLLDVELSRLGPLQFDGLVRGKRLDLMLRTQRPLDPAMRQEIAQIFQAAQETTGYTGQLFFQAGAPFLRTLAPQRAAGVVA